MDKETVEQTLNENFKPIVTPLVKIVGGFENIKKVDSVKGEIKDLDQQKADDLLFKSADGEGEDSTYLDLLVIIIQEVIYNHIALQYLR